MKPLLFNILQRDDYCYNCSSERAIEMYDVFGKPIGYSHILDNNESIMDMRLKFAKCSRCGKIYNIDRSDTKKNPRPMTININHFLNKYKENR